MPIAPQSPPDYLSEEEMERRLASQPRPPGGPPDYLTEEEMLSREASLGGAALGVSGSFPAALEQQPRAPFSAAGGSGVGVTGSYPTTASFLPPPPGPVLPSPPGPIGPKTPEELRKAIRAEQDMPYEEDLARQGQMREDTWRPPNFPTPLKGVVEAIGLPAFGKGLAEGAVPGLKRMGGIPGNVAKDILPMFGEAYQHGVTDPGQALMMANAPFSLGRTMAGFKKQTGEILGLFAQAKKPVMDWIDRTNRVRLKARESMEAGRPYKWSEQEYLDQSYLERQAAKKALDEFQKHLVGPQAPAGPMWTTIGPQLPAPAPPSIRLAKGAGKVLGYLAGEGAYWTADMAASMMTNPTKAFEERPLDSLLFALPILGKNGKAFMNWYFDYFPEKGVWRAAFMDYAKEADPFRFKTGVMANISPGDAAALKGVYKKFVDDRVAEGAPAPKEEILPAAPPPPVVEPPPPEVPIVPPVVPPVEVPSAVPKKPRAPKKKPAPAVPAAPELSPMETIGQLVDEYKAFGAPKTDAEFSRNKAAWEEVVGKFRDVIAERGAALKLTEQEIQESAMDAASTAFSSGMNSAEININANLKSRIPAARAKVAETAAKEASIAAEAKRVQDALAVKAGQPMPERPPEIDDLLQKRYGKTFDDATPGEIHTAMVEYEANIDNAYGTTNPVAHVAGGEELTQKMGMVNRGFGWNMIEPVAGGRGLLATIKDGFLTDGHMAIVDKPTAGKLFAKWKEAYVKKQAKKDMKFRPDLSLADAIKMEEESVANFIKEGVPVSVEAVIPKKRATKVAKLQGFVLSGGKNDYASAILSDGKTQLVINSDKYAFLKKNFPNSEFKFTGADSVVEVIEDGKLKALIMPMKLPSLPFGPNQKFGPPSKASTIAAGKAIPTPAAPEAMTWDLAPGRPKPLASALGTAEGAGRKSILEYGDDEIRNLKYRFLQEESDLIDAGKATVGNVPYEMHSPEVQKFIKLVAEDEMLQGDIAAVEKFWNPSLFLGALGQHFPSPINPKKLTILENRLKAVAIGSEVRVYDPLFGNIFTRLQRTDFPPGMKVEEMVGRSLSQNARVVITHPAFDPRLQPITRRSQLNDDALMRAILDAGLDGNMAPQTLEGNVALARLRTLKYFGADSRGNIITDSKEVLGRIVKSGEAKGATPHEKAFASLAKYLVDNPHLPKNIYPGIGPSIGNARAWGSFIHRRAMKGAKEGYYGQRNGSLIFINPFCESDDRMLASILHESLHSATLEAFYQVPSSLRMDLYRLATRARRATGRYRASLQPLDKGEVWYGLADPSEFITLSFTNKKFQDLLARVPALNPGRLVSGKAENSLLDEYKTWIMRALEETSSSRPGITDAAGRVLGPDLTLARQALDAGMNIAVSQEGAGPYGGLAPKTTVALQFVPGADGYIRDMEKMETKPLPSGAYLDPVQQMMAQMGMIPPAPDITRLSKEGLEKEFFRRGNPGFDYVLYNKAKVDKVIRATDQEIAKAKGPTAKAAREQAEEAVANATISDTVGTGLAETALGTSVEAKRVLPLARVVTNFRRVGADMLADASMKYERIKAQGITSDINFLKKIYNLEAEAVKEAFPGMKFNDEDAFKRLADIIEKRTTPVNAAEAQAAARLGGWFKRFQARATPLDIKSKSMFGTKKFHALQNYYPHAYEDLNAFLDSKIPGMKHFKDYVIENMAVERVASDIKAKVKNPVSAKQALEEAKNYYETVRSDMKTKKFGPLEYERVLSDEGLAKVRAKWQETFPDKPFPLERRHGLKVLSDYAVGMQNRLAWLETFGKDIDVGGAFYPSLVNRQIRQMQSVEGKKYILDFFDDYIRNHSSTSRVATALKVGNTIQNFKLLWAQIPNSFQFFTNTLPQTPLKDWPKVFGDMMKYYGEGITGNRFGPMHEYIARTGAESIRQDLQKLLGGAQGENLDKVSSAFLKYTGFMATENNNAVAAAFAGRRAVRTYAERLAESPTGYRHLATEKALAKFGMSPEQIAVIKTGHPEVAYGMQAALDASYQMKRTTQFIGEAFELFASWQKLPVRTMMKFKSFSYAQSSYVFNDILRPALRFFTSKGKEGDITPLVKAVPLFTASSMAAVEIKKSIYEKLGMDYYRDIMKGGSKWDKMMLYMLNTGNLGIGLDFLNAMGRGKERVAEFVAGPFFSDVGYIGEAMVKIGQDIATSFKYRNKDWLLNRGERMAGYLAKVAARINPTARVLLDNFFKKYKGIKSVGQLRSGYIEARKEYMRLLVVGRNPKAANDYWNGFLETVGAEYDTVFGAPPEAPTDEDISEFMDNQFKMEGETGLPDGSVDAYYKYKSWQKEQKK
jgi:hypothetical protein